MVLRGVMMKRLCLLAVGLCLLVSPALAAEPLAEVKLWTGDAPGSEGKTAKEVREAKGVGFVNVTQVHQPSITPYLPSPDKATGVAVVVIPGGGHRVLCVGHEGDSVARVLVEHGIAAFVLKYRLAREENSTYSIEEHALADTQRAVRMIRSRAEQWHVDRHKIGVMGFSAGGELASLVSLRPGAGKTDASDPIDRLDARPDFQALIYPGRSGDIQPTGDAPPVFLACSAYDRPDISEGLAEVYLRYKRAKGDAELHIYAAGKHGFGVQAGNQGAVAGWTDRFIEWLESKKFL